MYVGGGVGEAKLIKGELNSACFCFKLFCCVDVVIDLFFSLLHVVILIVVPILLLADLVVILLHVVIHCYSYSSSC